MAIRPSWPEDLGVRRVVVVGQGYVGLPLAMAAVDAGDAVVGLDVDVARIDALADGRSFVEDVSDATLRGALVTELAS